METLKVNERRDDTTKRESESRPARRSYYYDDATGYETYVPEEVDEDEAKEDVTGDARDGDVVQPRDDEKNAQSYNGE